MSDAGTVRVGLIGTGAIARAHLPGYLFAPDRVRLAAVHDPVPDAMAALAASVPGGVVRCATVEELLAADAVDAVDICTPHDRHAGLAIAAAEAGKHVLLEKPMACTLADCRRIADACDRAGVVLMIGQSLRYVESYRAVRDLVAAGGLGRVRSGLIEEFLPTGTERVASAGPRSWYNDAARAGGGVLMTQSTHHVDLFRMILGEVERVSAMTWTDHPGYQNGAEDAAGATLVFANGAQVQLRASNSARLDRMHFEIVGDDGVVFTRAAPDATPLGKHHAPAHASLREHGPVTRDAAGLHVPPALPLPPTDRLPADDAFVNEVQHFGDCCRDGAEPLSSGRDNLETMRTIFALYASAAQGGAWVRPGDL